MHRVCTRGGQAGTGRNNCQVDLQDAGCGAHRGRQSLAMAAHVLETRGGGGLSHHKGSTRFGFVRAALLPAVGACVVLAFGAMPGRCCFLRLT